MSAYSDAVKRMSGIVAHWSLDEPVGSSSAVDSVSGINGTYVATYTLQGKNSRPGHSNGVDLTSGYINVPDHASLRADNGASGKLSVCGWINLDTVTAGSQMLWTKYGSWQFRIESNSQVLLDFMDTAKSQTFGSVQTTDTLAVGVKTFIMFRMDRALATDFTIGWNGNWTRASSVMTGITGNAGDPFRIGARSDLGGAELDGGVQDVSYFNRYLSDAELNYLYALGQNPRAGVVY